MYINAHTMPECVWAQRHTHTHTHTRVLTHTNTICYYICAEFTLSCSVSSVQLLSPVRLLATPWTTAHQASLSTTNSRSLFKLISIESVMPSNHLILCLPLLLLPSILPSIRGFSNESALHIRRPNSSHNKTNNHFTPIMYIFLLVIFLLIFMVLFGFHFLFGLLYHL